MEEEEDEAREMGSSEEGWKTAENSWNLESTGVY